MNGQNKLIVMLSIVVGILFFVFVGLAVSYYASNLMARSSNVENVEEKSLNLAKDSSDKKPVEEVNKNGEDSKREPVYNIGIEETAFRQRFNRVADDELSELNLHLTRKNVYNGDFASVYQTPFDSTTSLLVSFEPDTELVRGVFLSGKPVTDDETILFLGAIADIVATLNPDLTPSGRKSLLQNLGMFDGKHTDYRTVNKSTYRNNIHYKLQGMGGNGVAFLAVAKDIGTEGGSSVRRDSPYNIMADMTNYIIGAYDNQNLDNSKSSPVPKEAEIAYEIPSLEMSLGGILIGDTKNKVYSKLGKESEITYEHNNGDSRYQYPNMEVVMSGNVVTAFVSKNAVVKTKRGIGQGDTVQRLFSVYGNPDMSMEYDGYLLHEYKLVSANGRNCLLRFAIRNGVVSYISGRIVD